MLSIDGYDQREGDIYFWSASAVNSTLLALLPIVHRNRACLAMSTSRNGMRWSRPVPLARCGVDVDGTRSLDHPVAGLLLRGADLVFYAQRHVPGIIPRTRLMHFRARASTLVRYAIPWAVVDRWVSTAFAERKR